MLILREDALPFGGEQVLNCSICVRTGRRVALVFRGLGDPFQDKESEQFVARYIERAPLSLEKLSIQDDIVTYSTKDGVAHEFDALEFLAALSVHIPKTYESITRYYGRYSCRRRGERAKLSPPPAEEPESDYRREFRKSSWAACILLRTRLRRTSKANPLACPP